MYFWTGGDGQTNDAGGAPLRKILSVVQIGTKEERIMRYVVTTLLVLGLGITAMAPVVFAQVSVPPSFTNQYGNQSVPLKHGSGGLVAEADGCWSYKDGVAYSCTQPTPMTMPTPSGSGGGVAGGSMICPVFGPCYEPQYKFDGGDRN
jgi:hypothetical protein